MKVVLSQGVPQLPGLTVDVTIVTVGKTSVVAFISATAANQQLPGWFRTAVAEVNPLYRKWERSEERRRAQVLVRLSLVRNQDPQDAIEAFLKGVLRKVEQRLTTKTSRPKARTQSESSTRPRKPAASPPYRFTPRALAYR